MAAVATLYLIYAGLLGQLLLIVVAACLLFLVVTAGVFCGQWLWENHMEKRYIDQWGDYPPQDWQEYD